MDMEKCIEIQNLQKSFGAIHAVNNLSLQVETGQLFAFLGVNGAGKSTTISMICGQLRQDAGQIYVNGRNTLKNMNAIKQDIGVVFQNSVLDRQLSVQDNLKNRAALYGITGDAGENFAATLEYDDGTTATEDELKALRSEFWLKKPLPYFPVPWKFLHCLSRWLFGPCLLLLCFEKRSPHTATDQSFRHFSGKDFHQKIQSPQSCLFLSLQYNLQAVLCILHPDHRLQSFVFSSHHPQIIEISCQNRHRKMNHMCILHIVFE